MMWLTEKTFKAFKKFTSIQKSVRHRIRSDTVENITRRYSTAADAQHSQIDEDFKEGLNIEGFIVTKVFEVPDFFLKCIKLVHTNTGAQYVHIRRHDTNNVFAVSFRTTPFDSTGIPHILEHMALCGSEKYPCRDPFFKMLNRSQATYMNALTGPDYTMYPFATQNYSDYKNLMSIYLDAAFKPKLRKLDFQQEAWRLEHKDVNDPSTPIIFKGVVFNEMKGAFSENQNLFYMNLMNNILPSHTYGVCSGGDPLKIPLLTYENLKRFHKDYYHPSNARFYSYGNFPLSENLKFVNESYLDAFGKIETNYSEKSAVPLESKWQEPRTKHIPCREDNMSNPDKQSSIAISYACSDITKIYDCFLLELVSGLLVDGPNSAFYKSLVEPNVAAGFSPVTGFCNYTKTTVFNVGLQGLNKKDFDWVVETFDRTVCDVVKKGFEKRQVEGLLHNIELCRKHQSSDFGLQLLHFINSTWNHDGDIETLLNFTKRIDTLRNDMKANPMYLEQFVERYIKDNPHRLILTMSPVKEFEASLLSEEEELLKSKISSLPMEHLKNVHKEGLALKEDREKIEDLSVLPTLTIADINRDIERTELHNTKFSGVPLQVCVQPTNGLTYFRGVISAQNLEEECKKILPLFCFVADKMGTSFNDYREMDLKTKLVSNGLNISHNIFDTLNDVYGYEEVITVSSFCLDRNVKPMFDIWIELFNNITLDQLERFNTLITMIAADYLNGIADSGHLYAMISSSSVISPAAQRNEITHGISFIKLLQEISQKSDLSQTLSIIKSIGSFLLNKERLRTALNISPDNESEILNHFDSFCSSLTGTVKEPHVKTFDSSSVIPNSFQGIHYVIPMQISFAAKSLQAVPFIHKDFPALSVLCQLLTTKYLLPVVREKGGAYGAGSKISQGGIINFYSYKDPNPEETLNVFDESLQWISKKNFTKNDIQEAKLGVFRHLETPIPPGDKGMRVFLQGLTDDLFQNYRNSLIALTDDDIFQVAEKYLDCEKNAYQGRSVIGPINENIIKRKGETWAVRE